MNKDEFLDEVQKQMPADGEFINFNGDDECEDCPGWDGKSPRCECGNRRVYWTEESGMVYAAGD